MRMLVAVRAMNWSGATPAIVKFHRLAGDQGADEAAVPVETVTVQRVDGVAERGNPGRVGDLVEEAA